MISGIRVLISPLLETKWDVKYGDAPRRTKSMLVAQEDLDLEHLGHLPWNKKLSIRGPNNRTGYY